MRAALRLFTSPKALGVFTFLFTSFPTGTVHIISAYELNIPDNTWFVKIIYVFFIISPNT